MTTTVVLVLMLPVCLSCPTGLHGPTCRAQNVALNRPTSQSSNHDITLYPAGNAVDGTTGHSLDSSTCTHTAVGSSQAWWTVTLDQSYWIYRFTIYNRNGKCDEGPCGARLNGFTVSVGTTSGAYTTCYQDTTNNATGPGEVINQHCTRPLQGNTVNISLSSASLLTLCEVLIYANSGQCPEGWNGPSCNEENVALNRSTSQSSNYDNTQYLSGNAVDGKTGHNLDSTPCTHTEVKPGQYWSVTLKESYWIYRFTIYNRNGGCNGEKCGARLNGFTVSLGTSSGAYTTCYHDTTTSNTGPGDVINEHCARPLHGNTVKISLSSGSPLTLCEVLVYGISGQCPEGWDGPSCKRENVALSRRTSQSSNYDSAHYLSGNAVDGKTGNSLENTPCTHTEVKPNQYWTVTLDKSYWIYRFTIYNRNETCDTSKKCGARLNGFNVSVRTSSGAYTTCYKDSATSTNGPGDVINEHCTSPVQGNTVKISLSSGSPLTLCEVLIYVCADGWYGETCDKPCVSATACLRCDPTGTRCDACVSGKYGPECGTICGFCAQGQSVCNTTSGSCPIRPNLPRCMPGYSGEKCDIVCVSGKYGPNCRTNCGFCAQGQSVCNTTSGSCPIRPNLPRCMPGYLGEKCDIACQASKWGADCLSSCGHCYNGPACDKASGECTPSGGNPRCSAGYHGTHCDHVCSAGKWGADCVTSCGQCYNGAACNRTSGECTLSAGNPRCSAGYGGTLCVDACQAGNWGADCQSSCGHCYNGATCYKASGECAPSGRNPRCSAGYKGTLCDDACSSYRWGPDCEKTCGHCHGGAVCDGVTGECPPGNPRCAAGYTEFHCVLCEAGKWGSNCLFTCSENCAVPTCNVTTGVCEGGCNAGYTGGRCNAVISAQVINYTAVIIGCVVSVTVAATIITTVFLVLRRRQSGSAQEAETSVRNTGAAQEVSNPGAPSQESDSGPNTYYNMAAREENPYEAVTEKEYDKIRLSRLDTDTNYTNLN